MYVTPLERAFSQGKPRDAGVVAMVLAIALAVFLGTIGYFAVGFATLTGCTDAYSCTQTSCAPCQGATHWLESGAVIQGVLAVAGIAFLVLARRRGRLRRALIFVAIAIAVSSVVAVGSTKVAADRSFCQAGYAGDEGGCTSGG